MKHLNIFLAVLLNVLFCAIVLYFFANYSQLRPYAGSAVKEVLAGLLLLATLYANYFLKEHLIFILYADFRPSTERAEIWKTWRILR